MSRKRRKKINKKKIIIFITIVLILITSIIAICYKINKDRITELKQNTLKQDIISHYNEFVITNKESSIYELNNNKYIEVGTIGKDEEITLDNIEVSYKDEYLKLTTFEEEYYIYYKDIDKTEKLSEQNDRYKKYIPFNKNVVTKDETNFYNEEGALIYSLPKSFDLPIIVNKKDTYGVEYNNRLLYVKKDDVSEIKENKNTDSKNTSGIAVLNYHFFYDTSISGDAAKCNQSICLSTTNLRKHLDYIKDNNIFTPSMKELDMYIDGYIQLPKRCNDRGSEYQEFIMVNGKIVNAQM